MAYSIEYTDFKGLDTKILISKGVESGIVNDFVTRVEADIEQILPTPEYSVWDVSTVIANTGEGHDTYLFGSYDYSGLGNQWDSVTDWYISFTIDGVVSDLFKYHWNKDSVSTEADIGSGMFNTSTTDSGSSIAIQINIVDADDVGHNDIFSAFVANRDTITVYPHEATPSKDVPVVEAQDCLKSIVGELEGTNHEFCGTDNPLSYKYYSDDKYSPFMASEVTINFLIRDADDHTAMKQILDGGYYISVYKRETYWQPVWHGKLSSRFYTESYAQYPYAIKLTGSDQLGSFDKYQPLMIDFPVPDAKTNIISLLAKFLMDESMYPLNYTGNKVTDLYFSSRFTNSLISKLASDIYLDPLNWMDDENQYASKKTMLSDVLIALGAKIFQWNYSWYVMDVEAQWDKGDVTWNRYRFLDDGSYYSLSNHTTEGHFVYPYVTNPSDVQVFNNAEMRYEPSWRLLNMELNYQENKENISGFTNTNGNFYQGHNGVTLELDNDGKLKYWSGYDVLTEYKTNSGWLSIAHTTVDESQYIETIIPQSEYDTFIFNVEILGILGLSYPAVDIEVKLLMNGNDKWLDNDEGDNTDFTWNDEFRTARFINNGSHNIQIGLPYNTITHPVTLKVLIHSHQEFGVEFDQTALIRNLYASFTHGEWQAADYKQLLEKYPNGNDTDLQIVERKYYWGMYHDTLPNENTFHRSSMYFSDGSPIAKFEQAGKTGENYLMDSLGERMVADNQVYTRTLTASYFSQLTPLSLMVDAEGIIYRFVSGEFQDKTSTWRNTYTQFKAIANIPFLPVRCDYSPSDYSELDYCIEFSTLYLKDYVVRIQADGGTLEAKECVEDAIDELIK